MNCCKLSNVARCPFLHKGLLIATPIIATIALVAIAVLFMPIALPSVALFSIKVAATSSAIITTILAGITLFKVYRASQTTVSAAPTPATTPFSRFANSEERCADLSFNSPYFRISSRVAEDPAKIVLDHVMNVLNEKHSSYLNSDEAVDILFQDFKCIFEKGDFKVEDVQSLELSQLFKSVHRDKVS